MLTLGSRSFADDALLVMAIVNRTQDSFYDRGATYAEDKALDRVRQAVAQGADIVDIGGVKAGPGETVEVDEEIRRTVPFVEAVRAEFPDVVVSVDTWRAEVGREVCAAGADLLNDAWGGFDPRLAEVAAELGAGLVCTHTNGATPRTPPHRPSYDDVVASAIADTLALAERAVAVGVAPESVLIDPAHDFDKNTWHSLELTRRLDEMVATGWPVLVSLSNKDFVGETLDRPVDERVVGTLATTAVSAWLGARVFRVHEVAETRDVLDMVASIRGSRPPARAVRGARMIVAAVVLPHPPLLFRELGGLADPVAELRAAVHAAVTSGLHGVTRVVVVGGADAPSSSAAGPGAVDVRRFGGTGERVRSGMPLSHGVATRVLDEVGWTGPVELRAVGWDATDREVEALATEITSGGEPTALLVLGDGSARRGEKAPGYLDERAFPFDDALAQALAGGDAKALRHLDTGLASELMVLGRSAFRVLGAVALGQAGPLDPTLLYRDDPFGVTYLVATWRFVE